MAFGVESIARYSRQMLVLYTGGWYSLWILPGLGVSGEKVMVEGSSLYPMAEGCIEEPRGCIVGDGKLYKRF